MARFDHLGVPVADYAASKRWYVETLGLEIEFDMEAQNMVAVRDTHDFTLFLYQGDVPSNPSVFMFTFSVDDVHAFYRSRSDMGVAFEHEPKMVDWGFGAELRDPDGYRIAIWDEQTMPKTPPD
jgi:predicted enzyme related to lactoylglutathione lyase